MHPHPAEQADAASPSIQPYEAVDPSDAHRLSFISFADVVQAEHVEASRDSVQLMTLPQATNRSPSPVATPPPPQHKHRSVSPQLATVGLATGPYG